MLADTGLPGGTLCLEITETALLTDPATVARTSLVRLRRMGVRIAIDDFGTGYSSLSHLARLPVDHLKVDRSFVGALEAPQSRAIVAAVLGLAQALGVTAVAEGVETVGQLAELRDLGCQYVQGWLTGRPASAAALELRLAAALVPGPAGTPAPVPGPAGTPAPVLPTQRRVPEPAAAPGAGTRSVGS